MSKYLDDLVAANYRVIVKGCEVVDGNVYRCLKYVEENYDTFDGITIIHSDSKRTVGFHEAILIRELCKGVRDYCDDTLCVCGECDMGVEHSNSDFWD